MKQVEEFARGQFADAKTTYPKVDPATVQFLSQIIGIPPEVLEDWKLDPDIEVRHDLSEQPFAGRGQQWVRTMAVSLQMKQESPDRWIRILGEMIPP